MEEWGQAEGVVDGRARKQDAVRGKQDGTDESIEEQVEGCTGRPKAW